MGKPRWILIGALYLLLIFVNRSVLADIIFNYSQLYEGNRCQLENGTRQGVCTKVINCPEKIRQIRMGIHSNTDRCGFSNVDEIVCCASNVSLSQQIRQQIRPADAACADYKKTVQKRDTGLMLTGIHGILAGETVNLGQYPYMAALGYVALNESETAATRGMKYVCGGTLISQKHVITAAHCISNIQGLVPVEVLLGEINLANSYSPAMQRIPISRKIKHPRYRRSFYYHDIAILELKNSAQLSIHVQPTCLMTKPSTSLTAANAVPNLVILGWGVMDFSERTSTELLKAEGLRLVNKTECSKSYKNNRAQLPTGLDDGMICAVDHDIVRRADTCQGDSGGPLLVGSDKFPPLVGITSFGQACFGVTPGVYVSIYHYLDWIEEQVWPAQIK